MLNVFLKIISDELTFLDYFKCPETSSRSGRNYFTSMKDKFSRFGSRYLGIYLFILMDIGL